MASRTQAPQRTRAARYVRAEDALPADLMALVQTHVEAAYVWIPSRATERRRLRDAEIFERRAAGESIHEVAMALGLTARRICQIQQRARRREPDATVRPGDDTPTPTGVTP